MAKESINKLWDFSDPKLSESRFRERLSQEEKENAPLVERMEILTQVARAEGLQQKFDEAHKTLDTVQATLASLGSTLVDTRYHLERGRAFNSSGNKEKAKEDFLKAIESGKKGGHDYYTIDGIHMMAIADEPTKQLEWTELGIKMAEASNEDRAKLWLGTFYNNSGWTYFGLKEYQKALDLFIKNEKFAESRNNVKDVQIAKWCQAKMYRFLKQLDTAISIQRTLEKAIQDKSMEEDGYVYEEIAECLLAQGNTNDAKPYFKRAYELLSKDIWLQKDEKARLDRMEELGK
jgi:tetratricopeptide (TPR) repeat protein